MEGAAVTKAPLCVFDISEGSSSALKNAFSSAESPHMESEGALASLKVGSRWKAIFREVITNELVCRAPEATKEMDVVPPIMWGR